MTFLVTGTLCKSSIKFLDPRPCQLLFTNECGLGLAKGWSAEKLEVLVTRYVSKLLKAKLTTLSRNVNDVA